MKKIVIDNYRYNCHFGEFVFNDVTIYIDDHNLNADSFNQETDDYNMIDNEIDRLEHESVRLFLKDNFHAIMEGKKDFTRKNLRGFLTYTKLKAVDLALLIGHSKGTISKMLKEGEDEYQIRKVTTHFLLSLLVQEYRERGHCRRLLGLESSTRAGDNFPIVFDKIKKAAIG